MDLESESALLVTSPAGQDPFFIASPLGPLPSSGDMVQEISARVCVPLATPLIRAGPRLRRAKTPMQVGTPRRSTRLAARPRAANSTLQA